MEPSTLLPTEGKSIALQGGHTIRFLHRATTSGSSLIEWMAPPRIPGPPLHIHRATDEGFYVLEGTFGFQAGEQTIHGPSGTYTFIPKGLVHTFWNQGPTPAKLLILISPPGFEQYFEELSDGLAAAGDSPEAAMQIRQALGAKYDIEVVGPPRKPTILSEV
jgi:mannose-6-phosphate isomerase-like protein (cupin superfamily)